ncbi:MAG: tetratricopeptide repeat protein [Proteobacteria bacterium]|nr:tetratricopeptide repeat protein [Pseudomonadota bacterium]
MELKKKINHPAQCPGRKPSAFSFFALLFLLVALGCLFSPFANAARAADKSEEEILQEQLKLQEENLWQNANKDFQAGKDQEAADYFFQYYRQYPDSPRAEEALWNAANLRRELSQDRPDADWGKIQEMFRAFTIDYPHSPHLSDAYYEVADAYYQMRFYREALTYFGLFLNRFADSPRANAALYMKARILLKIGRLGEAAEVYRELGQVGDEVDKLRGQAGLAHIDFAKGKYHDALAVYLKILKKKPLFYVDDPELLHNKGIAHLRVGNSQEGRKDLLQYLNISGDRTSRPEVLYELAESYLADGYKQMADRFYAQVLEEGEKDGRPAVLSRLRLAQETSATPEAKPVDQKPVDKKEEVVAPAGDKPFQDVLDLHYQDPSSQDARFELMRRYWQRKEYDQAYTMGKSYLRYETVEAEKKEVVDIMGQVLALRMEKLFDEKKFAAVYEIYKDEYPYVKLYGRATLLFLSGRALEEMGFYRQASLIYYRAMALGLTDKEQLDLYIHRAQAYLADNDIKSAQRLLKYLRKIYAADAAMGEVCFLSGHLREKQNRSKDALKFYQIAVEKPTFAAKKHQYAADYLRLLFELDEILDKSAILNTFGTEKWLPPQDVQYWFGKLAERYRKDNNLEKARDAYLAALAENMPQNNEAAQMLQLNLGDVLLLLGKRDEAGVQFRKALEGTNSLVKKLAQQRLTQEDIDKAMVETEAVMKN